METSPKKIENSQDSLQQRRDDCPLSSAKPGYTGLSAEQKSMWNDSQEKQNTSPISNWKETNPKDMVGQTKAPLDLVPDILAVEASLAFLEGALKYGRYNWRICGIRSSIYHSALKRHIKKWWNGEDRDPQTRVKHLANAIACLGILLDAELCGKLTDDRPPRAPIGRAIDDLIPDIQHLKELFKSYTPKQYTIEDGNGPDQS